MTLTEFSQQLRKALPFIIIGLLVFFIIFYIVRIIGAFIEGRSTKIALNPLFGKIKKLEIPDTPPSGGLTYSFETIEGVPQTATSAAHVYFFPPQTPRLGYREKIYLIARTIGFDVSKTKYTLSGITAAFKEDRKTLDIDISNFNFLYTYDFAQDGGFFSGAVSPDRAAAQNSAIEFLRAVDKYPEELAQGRTDAIYFFFNTKDKTMVAVDKNVGLTPNLIEIDFYRPDIDGLPIVPPRYFNSQNYVMLMRTGETYRVARAQIKYFERSSTQVGAYPLKTGPQAYEDLKAGKGFIASPVKDAKHIIINQMFLAYFDPQEYQEYLRPVYVFLGNNNFVGYVDGVREDYIAQ